MFDIGTMELLVIAVLAVVVVGPKELPRLLRGVAAVTRTIRQFTAEFRAGLDNLAAEVEREADPFADLKREEGITPGMTADEITEHIMANRAAEQAAADPAAQDPAAQDPADQTVKSGDAPS